MLGTANDNAHLCDPDDVEDARSEAWRAKIRDKSRAYSGRADLLDLATKTCIELRRVHGELETLGRLLATATDAEKRLRRRSFDHIRNRVLVFSDELEAMYEAMDEPTRKQFNAALGKLPKPRELAGTR